MLINHGILWQRCVQGFTKEFLMRSSKMGHMASEILYSFPSNQVTPKLSQFDRSQRHMLERSTATQLQTH